MNNLLTIGVIGVAAYGIFNLLRMKNVSDEIHTTIQNPRIHKVDWSGLVLRADALISNPTKDSLNITKPVVTLTSAGKILSVSNPENKHIQIQPLTTSKIEAIEIPLAWTALAPFISGIVSKIPALVSSLKGGNHSFESCHFTTSFFVIFHTL